MSVTTFDDNITPAMQAAITGPYNAQVDGTIYPRRAFHFYGDQKFVHDMSYMLQFSATVRAGTLAGSAFRTFATTIPINASTEYQGKLWMGGYAVGNIVNWDGALLLTETGVGTAPLIPGVFQETLLVFGTQTCKKRNLDGTWSAVSMPGGITSFKPRAVIQYLNKLYIGGFDDATTKAGKILSWDGTTLAVARTVSGNANATDVGCTDLAVFGGNLYYAHNALDNGDCYIGKFDGTTWFDAFKNFGDQLGAGFTIGCLCAFRASLFAGFGVNGGGALYESPGAAVDGTWTSRGSSLTGLYDMAMA